MFVKLYVTFLCINGFICSEKENYKYLVNTMEALDRTLNFILRDYKLMNVDGMLGVNMGQAHLNKAIEKATNSKVRNKLLLLKQKAEAIHVLQTPNLINSPYRYYVFNNYVIPPEVLTHDIEFSYGKLNPNPRVFTGPYNVSDLIGYARYVTKSTFSEKISDDCLVEVATASDDRNPHNCPASKACYDYMIKMPTSYDSHFPGYGVTHMTLYLQIGKSRNCTFGIERVDALINQQCTYILWELRKNVEFGYIPQLFDLFLEQIVFCGQEGFEEFLLTDYLEYILQEQNECDSFGIKKVSWAEVVKRPRIKRESNPMKCGANNHTTGLAVAALALYIRYLQNRLQKKK